MAENERDEALSERAAQRTARIGYERALLEEARADVAAGRLVEGEELERHLDAFVRGEPLQAPGLEAPHRQS
ncbi:hypothetical protein [Salinarimonas ramus]|nr:hypothetical protein [Salinarimonas ramus]